MSLETNIDEIRQKVSGLDYAADAYLNYANSVTGAEDTNVGDAIMTLAAGYGKEGGSGMEFIEEIVVPSDTKSAEYTSRYSGRGYHKMRLEIVWHGTAQNAAESAVNIAPKVTNTSGVGNQGLGNAAANWAACKSGDRKYSMFELVVPKNSSVRTAHSILSNMSQSVVSSYSASVDIKDIAGFSLWSSSAYVGAGTQIFVYAEK